MRIVEKTITGIDGSTARLTGYVAESSSEMADTARPAMLILPGGGYAMTSDRESDPIALRFTAAGYQTFILRYSCAPSRHPVALLQAAQAMRLIRAHADDWRVDPARVALLGFSAGGHLAATLATASGEAALREHGFTEPQEVRPDALLLAYPVITTGPHAHRRSISTLLGPEHRHDAALLDMLSIERHIDGRTPPVFVWHTMTDPTVPVENTLMLIQACHEAGVRVEAHLFPEGGHGLSLATRATARAGSPGAAGEPDPDNVVPAVQIWPDLALTFLAGTFADRP
ncbi:alpha/beta hydrolase [Bifidobacterium saguinibicoloris]|uniref:alpha/beta hydrolase n=1 Tax=Bifidobacterium saguinibicoloris TaxID=2834433 RepID=UPI001C5A05B8|nr:alpha/beta hydrolase [Bifidobacterium saguinibicoloris]MBW3080475.1 alpha/beta hydrolase [Bifidobacterium saguinibicoloris]